MYIMTKSGKLVIIQRGNRRTKARWEVWQKALDVLHLENCVFSVQVILKDNVHNCGTHEKMLNYDILIMNYETNYAGKNPNGFHIQRELLFYSKHGQTVTGIT
ncbi:zinc finger protein 268-like [Marmota flaviventris]|uniref:zinc finger protein 268-like n=1 Tax=Marmota flaviventris TaxID=93162 RepID=UPI000FFF8748|nr:zinc finger protein 268-like [Marmota flaviventris]